MKLSPEELRRKRWLRALEIAKACFFFEGYDVCYLEEIERHIKEGEVGNKLSVEGG